MNQFYRRKDGGSPSQALEVICAAGMEIPCKTGGILQLPDNLSRWACVFVDKYRSVHIYVQQVQNLYLTSNGQMTPEISQ